MKRRFYNNSKTNYSEKKSGKISGEKTKMSVSDRLKNNRLNIQAKTKKFRGEKPNDSFKNISSNNTQIKTSWGNNAEWYKKMVSEDNSYQNKVILPALLKSLNLKKTDNILDIGCGTGFFAQKLADKCAEYTGFDIGDGSIKIAKETVGEEFKNTHFFVADAEKLDNIKSSLNSIEVAQNFKQFDKIICILAIQNIKDAQSVFKNIKELLKRDGEVIFVLNHPAFRIPRQSFWDWTTLGKVENSPDDTLIHFRGTTHYMSEKAIKMQMNPGKNPKDVTYSFHRPLSFYLNEMAKLGFSLTECQELISHRKTDQGPKKTPELERTRQEIPMFMLLKWRV